MKILKAAACLVVLTGTAGAAGLLAPVAFGQATTVKRVQAPRVFSPASGSRLGISVREVEDEDAKSGRLSTTAGVFVEEVSTGSPAEKAGLRKGDIIVEFDGERVRSARQLARLVQETPDGRRVPGVVVRDGQRVTLTLEPRAGSGTMFERLGELERWGRDFSLAIPARPVPPATPAPRAKPVPPSIWRMDDLLGRGNTRFGLTVDALSPQLAEYFGTKQGVLVTSVRDDSAAAKAGIKAGDVITTFNGSAIDDPAELRRRLQNVDDGEEFTIGVMRDKRAQTLKGKLDQSVRRRISRTII
jgi:serine protease Do